MSSLALIQSPASQACVWKYTNFQELTTMIPIPNPEDYDVSLRNGFLSDSPPLESLPDEYYSPWEYVIKNLQGLILSKRLHEAIDRMPVLSTDGLVTEPEWRRAYSILGFMTHAYVWGGDKPKEWVPPPISVPFANICAHLELPMVATYAGLCLWNWKPISDTESVDTLTNLDMIDTFTGSLDEKWFYLVSVAIEARGAAMVPLMLDSIQAARQGNRSIVTESLRTFAERLDQLGAMLAQMSDNCDPHVFYHRIRPYLAGSKNMKDAGLPQGIVFDNGGPMNKQRHVQYSGGSNAQSSLLQFFDAVLGVEHRPTGQRQADTAEKKKSSEYAPQTSFIHEMRQYMPGPHARFLRDVTKVACIRDFVATHSWDRALTLAFDACLAMLSSFRDVHLQLVSRYIVIKSHQAKAQQATNGDGMSRKVNLATRPKEAKQMTEEEKKAALRGTGGTSLMPFLRQARDETAEPAVNEWTQRYLHKGRRGAATTIKVSPVEECQGLAAVWRVDNCDGGLCLI
ncbi:Hypothetical protein R9X50_00527100 [Acrodontium crateriforme]|uniref:Indoleamine 2,3-dioxygenase n=1 Tax=Acrodontium crateriforme TaxID=150365 RepID=A0AAQ3M916_9PEZI|nr:Hypothetical protein R9X50_00527100 [Acrodontium crateriforme]